MRARIKRHAWIVASAWITATLAGTVAHGWAGQSASDALTLPILSLLGVPRLPMPDSIYGIALECLLLAAGLALRAYLFAVVAAAFLLPLVRGERNIFLRVDEHAKASSEHFSGRVYGSLN